MPNKDLQLMQSCVSEDVVSLFSTEERFEFPLDSKVVTFIKKKFISKIKMDDNDYEIFKYMVDLRDIWIILIEKSIKCLRYHDGREPFEKTPDKKPLAYGKENLLAYFDKYIEFENVLYGSNKYYRDHVVHVFRTWLSGLECMLKNNGKYLKSIQIVDGIDMKDEERLSVWTLIALTHDLGYPLEKAKDVIAKTQQMLSSFIVNPNISMDLSFHGVQNYMNDFIVRLMSSKMEYRKDIEGDDHVKIPLFAARLQPKYYFKFQKSLEKPDHGIISAIIIYKLLTYFLESDYNINEDYYFNKEESRQFYIRREILRAIASHTCKDVYQMSMCSFAFLLIIADDSQEWGRKYISELYVKSEKEYELRDIKVEIGQNKNENNCEIVECFRLPENIEDIAKLLKYLQEQCNNYIKIFRDGQDTINRDFVFGKKCEIEYQCNPMIKLDVTFKIDNKTSPTFAIIVVYTGDETTNEKMKEEFFNSVFENKTKCKKISGGQLEVIVQLDN
jgi:hypothetical protein